MPSRGEHSRFLGGVLANTLEAGVDPAPHSPRPRRDVRSSVAKPPATEVPRTRMAERASRLKSRRCPLTIIEPGHQEAGSPLSLAPT